MRQVNQYFLTSSNVDVSDATKSVTIDIVFPDLLGGGNAVNQQNAEHGQATLALNLATTSGTATVAIKAKNIYGNSDIIENDYWTVLSSVSVTTSGVTVVKMLHVSNTANFDPNASGLEINLSWSESVTLEYRGRLLKA